MDNFQESCDAYKAHSITESLVSLSPTFVKGRLQCARCSYMRSSPTCERGCVR